MDYEIEPSQDPLDRPPKAEWGDHNTDCFGYEDIAKKSPTNLEKPCREQARTYNRREHGQTQDGKSKRHLERHGIKPILARIKHSQTNGKLEGWFGEHQKHRLAFSSFEEFREWYNNRPLGSLEFEHLETPVQAFRRKMRLEMYFTIGHRLFRQ